MARGRQELTEAKFKRYIKVGRGQGSRGFKSLKDISEKRAKTPYRGRIDAIHTASYLSARLRLLPRYPR